MLFFFLLLFKFFEDEWGLIIFVISHDHGPNYTTKVFIFLIKIDKFTQIKKKEARQLHSRLKIFVFYTTTQKND